MQLDNSLYTVEVAEFILTRPWPKGFLYNVFEDDHTLYIVMYRQNLAQLSYDDIMRIRTILLTDIRDMNYRGIPIEPKTRDYYE